MANSRWQAAEGRAATGCWNGPICTPDGVLDGFRDGSGTPSGVHPIKRLPSGGVAPLALDDFDGDLAFLALDRLFAFTPPA